MLMYEYANNYQKLNKENHHKLFAVFKQKINYNNSRKAILIRAFAGTIFANASRTNSSNFFSLSGNNDYTYDKAFFDRNNLNRNQMHELDGAFKANTFMPTLRNMIGLNIKVPFTSRFPLGVYADAAYSNEKQKIDGSTFDFGFGVYMPIVAEVIEVYFPVLYGQRLYSTNSYKEVIRFMIDFQMLQPQNLKRSLQLF
jgi:hypothetical protein